MIDIISDIVSFV